MGIGRAASASTAAAEDGEEVLSGAQKRAIDDLVEEDARRRGFVRAYPTRTAHQYPFVECSGLQGRRGWNALAVTTRFCAACSILL